MNMIELKKDIILLDKTQKELNQANCRFLELERELKEKYKIEVRHGAYEVTNNTLQQLQLKYMQQELDGGINGL